MISRWWVQFWSFICHLISWIRCKIGKTHKCEWDHTSAWEPILQSHRIGVRFRDWVWLGLKLRFLFRVITARNEVGARLYFHRRLWFCPRGCLPRGGACPGGCLVPGGCLLQGRVVPVGSVCSWVGACSRGSAPGGCLVENPSRTATATGGTHPTGMHSCFEEQSSHVCLRLIINDGSY